MITDHSIVDLPPLLAYGAWRLRQQAFVLEQACLFSELDGRDLEPGARHVVLVAEDDPSATVIGYLRVLDDGEAWRIGRLVLDPAVRGQGHAEDLMRYGLAITIDQDGRDVVLDAQTPLERWYARFGFERDGADFLEDDIAHAPMRLRR